jgi:hypothetical protein
MAVLIGVIAGFALWLMGVALAGGMLAHEAATKIERDEEV